MAVVVKNEIPSFTLEDLARLEKTKCVPCKGEGYLPGRHADGRVFLFACPQCATNGVVYRMRRTDFRLKV